MFVYTPKSDTALVIRRNRLAYKKILIPLNGSIPSEAALPPVQVLTAFKEAKIVILQEWEPKF